jgi:RNA polymerase sigma-70 factor (ECF subfamily)
LSSNDVNEREFLGLVEANRPRIQRLCRVYAHNPADAEDLYQEMLVQIWRSLPLLRERQFANSWLYRVAINTAISFVRKQKPGRAPIATEDAELHRRADEAANAVHSDNNAAQIEQLYEALDKLNKIEKALLTLYLEDLSYDEIGVVLGLNGSNVGVMLHRAKKKLTDLMQKEASR